MNYHKKPPLKSQIFWAPHKHHYSDEKVCGCHWLQRGRVYGDSVICFICDSYLAPEGDQWMLDSKRIYSRRYGGNTP